MRASVTDRSAGYFHEAGFYGSDEEFRAMIVPFVEEGTAAGEPVVVGFDERRSELLRSWLNEPSAVTFTTGEGLYGTPARAITSYQAMIERHLAAGAPQIRLTGDVPHPGNGRSFEGWGRYEFALNTVWDEFPVHSLCLYDATTVPARVRDVVERAHPHLLTATGEHHANGRYEGHVTPRLPVPADPLESTTPAVELRDPTAAEARDALDQMGRDRVDDQALRELRLGISEGVANARQHGVPPTIVHIWATHDRVVATVQDQGHGPTDPLAGLVPESRTTFATGMGLWVTHLLDVDATLVFTTDGFSLRLRAGRTPTPSVQ